LAKKKIDLNGKNWTKFSVSVWDIIKTKEESKLKHPAMFPSEICERLIKIYAPKGGVVLDPFLGSGSTLVAAKSLARKGIGIELNKEYSNLTKKRLKMTSWGRKLKEDASMQQSLLQIKNNDKNQINESQTIPEEKEFIIHNKDCMKVDKFIKPESVDFILTSPPYWDVLNQKRTADYKEIRNYSDSQKDLGNISDYGEFINKLGDVFENCKNILKPGGHCCIIVMDLRKKDKFYPFHSDLADEMKKKGFKFEDIIIWNRLREYNNLRCLGYPYVFRVNKIHEYILIFKKE